MFKSHPTDVKGIRGALLQFIKEQLQKVEGGEGQNIKGMHLFITCSAAEKHLYEAALYIEDENRFQQEEVQKIADDYAINLPAAWVLEVHFTETPPPEAIAAVDVDAALFISTRNKPAIHKEATAFIKVLNGEAEKAIYTLTSNDGKVTIGRDKKAQTADGFYRENKIAFPGDSNNQSNRSISRQHAHIEWDANAGSFYIFADEGGIPPLNKLKIRTVEGVMERVQTTEFGHRLKQGDQIMLGESAVLEFSYT